MITCIFENGNKASLRHVTVTCLVIRDHQILLVKRAQNLINPGKYASPGGFVSRDETIAQAAIREVLEETGYSTKIKSLLITRDNPDRPQEDRQNIDFVFIAEPLEKVQDRDKESMDVRWFDLDKLPNQEDFAFDHYEDIKLYLKTNGKYLETAL